MGITRPHFVKLLRGTTPPLRFEVNVVDTQHAPFGPQPPNHVELLRVLAMRKPLFLELSLIGIHPSNLLKIGVEIYSYNDHRSALSPEPVGWL